MSTQTRLIAIPLHASLSMAAQHRAFEQTPVNTRKVIVSTNLAETSVTIENVVYVIDCGFVKVRSYDPSFGVSSLTVTPISKV